MSGAPQQMTLVTAKAVGARPRPAATKAKPASTPGFKEEDAVIVCEDNLVFMRTLPDASVKLIVTSPPYNMGKEYETKSSLGVYLEEQRATITEAVRLLHPKGSICWQIGMALSDG
ncbi:MAG TPA: DNA methyltransferase [Terriglobales bacterium]|nr:DNA methyltransferase [Terriglobales bacterium]